MIKLSEIVKTDDSTTLSIEQIADNAIATFEGKPLKEGQPLFSTAFSQKGKTASKFVALSLIEIVLKAFSSIGNAFTKAERVALLATIWGERLANGATGSMPDNFAKMLNDVAPMEGVPSEQERYDAIRSTNENGRSQLAVIRRCHAVLDTKKEKKGEYTESNRPLDFQTCLGSDGLDDLRKAVKQALQFKGDCSNANLQNIVNKVCAILPNARNSEVTLHELNLDGEYPAASEPVELTAQQEMEQAALAAAVA